MKKLKAISNKYGLNFNIQIYDGDYNIYCSRNDFHDTDVCSVGGYKNLSEAIKDIISMLTVKSIIKNGL